MHPLFLLLALFGLVFAIAQEQPDLDYAVTVPDTFNNTQDLDTGGQAGFPINREKRWPRSIAWEVIIPWCFKDVQSEQAIGAAIDRGWETWTRTIGQASRENRHNLQLKHWMPFNTNYYPYCYETNGHWNRRVPTDAVVISFANHGLNTQGRSTQGYEVGNTPGRHQMILAPSQNPDWTAAHELGHIFGLLHEHQRADRDYHIHYECKNVYGYQQALQRAMADGYTSDQLCNQAGVAQLYGWIGAEFIRFKPLASDIFTPYDINSIMHYDGRHAANSAISQQDPTNPTLYPMFTFNAKRTQSLPLPLKGTRPYPYFDISAGDKATILAMYSFYPF